MTASDLAPWSSHRAEVSGHALAGFRRIIDSTAYYVPWERGKISNVNRLLSSFGLLRKGLASGSLTGAVK
jgi:hypothetical protein